MFEYLIKTERLGLRNWQTKDIASAKEMNADLTVMEFFPAIWSPTHTERFIQRMRKHYRKHSFCYFAVDELKSNTFIGFIGLTYQTFKADFTPCVDLGWRLLPQFWNKGYATEGANACLHFAFTELNLHLVYSIAPEINKKSQRVMHKIGMKPFVNFEHPKIENGSPLKPCVAYRIERD